MDGYNDTKLNYEPATYNYKYLFSNTFLFKDRNYGIRPTNVVISKINSFN